MKAPGLTPALVQSLLTLIVVAAALLLYDRSVVRPALRIGMVDVAEVYRANEADDQGGAEYQAVVGDERCRYHEQAKQDLAEQLGNTRLHTVCPRRRSNSLIASSTDRP